VKILGIDTTTKFLCVGVYDNGRICEYNLELERKHSALLMVTLRRILEALSWKPQDIDYFACGLGPGSFTGSRIGAAAIKGLAWSLKKPIVSISSLDVLARNVDEEGAAVIPVLDARRGLVYCSIYQHKGDTLKRTSPYMLLTLDDLFKKIKPGSILLGDALALYQDEIARHVKGVKFLDKDYWRMRAGNIIAPALEKIASGSLNTAFDIKPIYLYPKECQIKK
jgi:tRNA threonylcarbamoyladenosine biosynthesis protein TsaB